MRELCSLWDRLTQLCLNLKLTHQETMWYVSVEYWIIRPSIGLWNVTTKYHLPIIKPKLKYSIEKIAKLNPRFEPQIQLDLEFFFCIQYVSGLSLFVAATFYAVCYSCKTYFRARIEIVFLLAIGQLINSQPELSYKVLWGDTKIKHLCLHAHAHALSHSPMM